MFYTKREPSLQFSLSKLRLKLLVFSYHHSYDLSTHVLRPRSRDRAGGRALQMDSSRQSTGNALCCEVIKRNSAIEAQRTEPATRRQQF